MIPPLSQLLDKPTATAGASGAVSGAREAVAHTMEHVQVLGELLQLECAEYMAQQQRRGACVAAAGFLLLVSYGLACALAAVLLAPWLGIAGALAVVLVVNLLTAVALLLRASALGKATFAPALREELKNDWQCLKLLIKGSAKS